MGRALLVLVVLVAVLLPGCGSSKGGSAEDAALAPLGDGPQGGAGGEPAAVPDGARVAGDATPRDGAMGRLDGAPVDGLVPDASKAHDGAPAQDAAPAHDASPARDASPVHDVLPAQDAAPAHDASPARDGPSAQDAAPAHDGPPAPTDVSSGADLGPRPTGTLQGVVLLPPEFAGIVVTEAEVELADALGGHLAFTQPDPEGAFAFSGLTPGEYAVIATLAGFAPARATATVGAGETVDLGFLLLAPDIQVAVVRGEALLVGAPVDGHAGTLVDVPATPFSVSTAANGSFRLELSPGNWQLLLSHAGYASVLLALGPLVAGEERDLGTIFLPPLQR